MVVQAPTNSCACSSNEAGPFSAFPDSEVKGSTWLHAPLFIGVLCWSAVLVLIPVAGLACIWKLFLKYSKSCVTSELRKCPYGAQMWGAFLSVLFFKIMLFICVWCDATDAIVLPRCNVILLLQIPQNCLLSLCCCFVGMSTLLPLFLPHIFISPS